MLVLQNAITLRLQSTSRRLHLQKKNEHNSFCCGEASVVLHNPSFLLLLLHSLLLSHRRNTLGKIGAEWLMSISSVFARIFTLLQISAVWMFGNSRVLLAYVWLFANPFIYHRQPQSIISYHINCRLEIEDPEIAVWAISSAPVVSGGPGMLAPTPQFRSRIILCRRSPCSYLLTTSCIDLLFWL